MTGQSCVSDAEIRALYTNRPCPQEIVMNAEISCSDSQPSLITSDQNDGIALEQDYLEKQIVLKKSIIMDCPDTHVLTKLIWEPAVYFDYRKHNLTPTAKNSLDQNIRILFQFSKLFVAIRGFTDNRGNHAYNQSLASRRAITTLNYLQKQGIRNKRMIIAPVGETAPLLPNQTEENMAINRRVEMLLLDMTGEPVPYVILTKELRSLFQRKMDKQTFCKVWKKRVLWYPGIFFHADQHGLRSDIELKKLEANIGVLKAYPEFMISVREFSSNDAHANRAMERIQYIASDLYRNKIDNKRIQIVPPEETLVFKKQLTLETTRPCVEMLLLDHRARPFSVIVNLDRKTLFQ